MKYFVLMVLLSFGAFASVDFSDYVDHSVFTPVEGMWFDESEPGRGVTLEIQDGRVLATFFGYKANGEAQWWQGVGYRDDDSLNVYSGSFSAGVNGQCVGCPYTAPEFDPENSIGDFTLSFTDANTAELTWAGKDMTLVKYLYGYEDLDLGIAKGVWSVRAEHDNLSFKRDLREFLLFNEYKKSGQRLVLTGYEMTTNAFAAATVAYLENGKNAVVFAWATPSGAHEVFSVYLNSKRGFSDLSDKQSTGYFHMDAESNLFDAQPVKAFNLMSVDDSGQYINYYNDLMQSLLPTKSGYNRANLKLDPYMKPTYKLQEAIDILEATILKLYDGEITNW